MHLSYKFGEVATYDSDINLYFQDDVITIYYFKEQNKVDIYVKNNIYKTINDVKKIGYYSGAVCVLTNSNTLYIGVPAENIELNLNDVVDFVGENILYYSYWDIDLYPGTIVVAFANDTRLYHPLVSNSALMTVPITFQYDEMCSIGHYGNDIFLATKDTIYCVGYDDNVMRYLKCNLASFPNWISAGFMRYEPSGDAEYSASRMVLFFGGGDLQNCIAVDLRKLSNTFRNLSNGDYFEYEYEDQFNNGVITPLTEKRVSGRCEGIDFCDNTNRYIKTTISLLDPPRISSVVDSNGLEIANISELAVGTSPITEITFVGTLYNACYIRFQQSGVLNSTFIRYEGTVPEFESIEIHGITINVGETKAGFNISGDFSIKINSKVSSPTLQGNFISKDNITTPFTKIKFIDKNGTETELNDFNFIAKGN